MNKLTEASVVDKILTSITKAQSQLLDAADTLDTIINDSQANGGKIAELLPGHIEQMIMDISEIVDGTGESTLSAMDRLIRSMPLGDTLPITPSQKRALRTAGTPQQIDVTPDVQEQPRSKIVKESIESVEDSVEDYEEVTEEPLTENFSFSWDSIRENSTLTSSDVEGISLKELSSNNIKKNQSIKEVSNQVFEKKLEAIEEAGEVGTLEGFDLKKMNNISGIDSMPSFGSISTGELKIVN